MPELVKIIRGDDVPLVSSSSTLAVPKIFVTQPALPSSRTCLASKEANKNTMS